jgi:hypothetical protein
MTIRGNRSTFILGAWLLLAGSALAADNLNVKDGSNASQCVSAKDLGSSTGCANPLVPRYIPTDGAGSTVATVKSASTAAAAADTSLVVGLSPNSPVPTGTNSIGTVQPGNTQNSTPWLVSPVPQTGNGWTTFLANGLSTTVQTVKGSAGELGTWYCYNPSGVVTYLQIFDTSGTVTLGSTAPVQSKGVPAFQAATIEYSNGLHFGNAIKIAATTSATGSGAPATAMDCDLGFK